MPGLVLLRDANVHDPDPIGRADVLIGGGRILAIGTSLPRLPDDIPHDEVDLAGAVLAPGLIDAHVHVTGGGGEAGFASRVPAPLLEALSGAGITSVVGVLGTDGTTRTMRELVARTYALRELGLSAWCWTGNYEVPVKTLTGSVRDDLVFVDPVIGVGELAISDHRSSQPTLDEVLRVAADVHVAGLTTGKAGVLHLHLGDGSRGLDLVRRALAHSELPPRVFHPTHVNRNPRLWQEALELGATMRAPWVDLTAFPADEVGDGLSAAEALRQWHAAGRAMTRLTCSSDGGGCMPHLDAEGHIVGYGVGQSSALLATLREAVQEHGLALGDVLGVFTRNVATLLRLLGKGRIAVGADADLVVLDADLRLRHTLAGGRFFVRDGAPVVMDPFSAGVSSDVASGA